MFKSSNILKIFYPSLVWNKKVDKNVIYLTFDDGPVPGVTDFVLQELDKVQAKATFFCVGDNVVKHTHVFTQLLAKGHRVGNHTFNHMNGWNTDDNDYFSNIILCEDVFAEYLPANRSKLFRPPYGRIKKSQIKHLKNDYHIIMWDVLTKDYDHGKSVDLCLKDAIRSTEAGSIVVFHDRYKNEERLRYMLPRYLSHFMERGFTFETL